MKSREDIFPDDIATEEARLLKAEKAAAKEKKRAEKREKREKRKSGKLSAAPAEAPRDGEWKGRFFESDAPEDEGTEISGTITVSQLSGGKEPERVPVSEKPLKPARRPGKKKAAKEAAGKEKVSPKKAAVWIGITLLCGAGGLGASWLVAFLSRNPYDIRRFWPIMLSSTVFFLSTAAFFGTHGRQDRLFGVFSVLSAVIVTAELFLILG